MNLAKSFSPLTTCDAVISSFGTVVCNRLKPYSITIPTVSKLELHNITCRRTCDYEVRLEIQKHNTLNKTEENLRNHYTS